MCGTTRQINEVWVPERHLMKKTSLHFSLLVFGAAILAPSAAIAQNNDAAKTTAPVKPATATVQTAREASSGMATGRREAQPAQPSSQPANAKNSGHATETLKPSAIPATAPTGQPSASADTAKHISNVKWQDRQVSLPACDGASKDAAKCTVAPSTSTNTPAPAAESKRENKVESFSVKQ